MNTVAKFEKISMEQFNKTLDDKVWQSRYWSYSHARSLWEEIQLPKRSTEGSAGYDFFAPYDIVIPFGESLVIPTGIKCSIRDDWFLALFPRSGQGFEFGIEITNTVGIIDSDYYNNKGNEGHIMMKITNKDSSIGKDFRCKKGKAFCQGIFLPYGVTVDDNKSDKAVREGGFGSTSKEE